MSACTMLFLESKISSCGNSLLPKCFFFSASKLFAIQSSNEAETQPNEDRRKRRETDMTLFLLNGCGLSKSQVLVMGQRMEDLFKRRSIRRAQQAVQFFRDSGFTEDQVSKIVFLSPNYLGLKVDTTLKPKIEFLKALGFSGSNLGRIVSRAPRLLGCNLEKNLGPKIELLRQSLTQQILVYVIRISPRLLLESEEGLKLKIEYVKNLGVLEGSKAFAIALSVLNGIGLENLENKLKYMAMLGLLENEILHIVRKFPGALRNGNDKITKNMDFLKNTAGFQPDIVVSYPAFLSYSVENRLQPRHEVIEFLRKTNPTKLPKNVAHLYHLSAQRFAEKFLKGSPEATKMFEKYKDKSMLSVEGQKRGSKQFKSFHEQCRKGLE